MDNLPELRDIHLPKEGISIFPIAYGWWLVLGAVVALILLFLLIKALRKQSKKLYARYLLNRYAKEDTLASAVAMSEILRRICLKKYPEAVAFSGGEWTDFLLKKSKSGLSKSAIILLQTAPYRASDDASFTKDDISQLRKFCFAWVGENL